MRIYEGRYPVFVSHTKELEQMQYFTAGLQERQEKRGKNFGPGYECLLKVRRKCADLLLRMYAEDSDIILLDKTDHWWTQAIIHYVETVIPEGLKMAG